VAASTTAQFQFDKVSLESRLSLSDLGAMFAEDCWGYVSPSGREYAIVGLSQGTGFVEITNPAAPVIVAIKVQCTRGRDMKVYQNFVYSTVEVGPTYIYDVSDIDNGMVSLENTYAAGAHNLAVDEVSGFLYHAVGGPLDIYDLCDATQPAFVGSWPGQTHDVQVVTYTSGPYSGRQIAFVFAGSDGDLQIVDVTDKTNTFLVAQESYPSPSYTHQGWLTEDRQLLYLNDELDGIARTTIIDVSDLTTPTFISDFSNGLPSTDHNLYVRDGFIFEANYTSGLRIFNASDPLNPVEAGFFDTYPSDNGPGFSGAWTAYPFFPSGTVIVNDRSSGLFVLDPFEATHPATVGFRNAGANPASYVADPPLLGSTWTASVNLGLTGHSLAGIFAFSAPTMFTLGGGQVLLFAGSFRFSLPPKPGPVANWTETIPNNPALVGTTYYTQALHYLGVTPFALSNAQDLTVGY
jgi:choice-of-anchor B domain-containing protein